MKVISFDLDGCICDSRFDELIWRKLIPEIYGKENGLGFDEAYAQVTAEYSRLYKEKEPRWREILFWFEHFRLKADWRRVMEGLQNEIFIYGDVVPVVKRLRERYKVVLFSTANRDFLEIKMKTGKLDGLFDEIFLTSDFGEMKKTGGAFNKMLEKLGVGADEVAHIGDNLHDDYEIPHSVGLKAFVIDRRGKLRTDFAVRTLYEFVDELDRL